MRCRSWICRVGWMLRSKRNWCVAFGGFGFLWREIRNSSFYPSANSYMDKAALDCLVVSRSRESKDLAEGSEHQI